MDTVKLLREQMCEIGKLLWQQGFTPSNAGNICVKVAEDEYLCTPTRVSKHKMTPDMILRINGKLECIERMAPYEMTSEIKIHVRALQIRAKHGAIATIHTHPPYTQVFSLLNVPFMEQEGEFVGPKNVPVVPYAAPGSWELADTINDAMEAGSTVIMGGHGLLTVGDSLEQAYMLTEMVEHSAKVAYLMKQIQK